MAIFQLYSQKGIATLKSWVDRFKDAKLMTEISKTLLPFDPIYTLNFKLKKYRKFHFHPHSVSLANSNLRMLLTQINSLSLRPIRRPRVSCAFPTVTVCGACRYHCPWKRQHDCKASQSTQKKASLRSKQNVT